MIQVADALSTLRPNTEWQMLDNNISTIVWYTPNVEPLTEAEVATEMQRLEQVAADADAARVAARESAVAKLSALGLNEVEINAMMGGF
jgi:hypothetical protein